MLYCVVGKLLSQSINCNVAKLPEIPRKMHKVPQSERWLIDCMMLPDIVVVIVWSLSLLIAAIIIINNNNNNKKIIEKLKQKHKKNYSNNNNCT